jgi:hypothetical protein
MPAGPSFHQSFRFACFAGLTVHQFIIDRFHRDQREGDHGEEQQGAQRPSEITGYVPKDAPNSGACDCRGYLKRGSVRVHRREESCGNVDTSFHRSWVLRHRNIKGSPKK